MKLAPLILLATFALASCKSTDPRPTSIGQIRLHTDMYYDETVGVMHHIVDSINAWNYNNPSDMIPLQYPRRVNVAYVNGQRKVGGWWTVWSNTRNAWEAGFQLGEYANVVLDDRGRFQRKNAIAELSHYFIAGGEQSDYDYMRKLGFIDF